MVDSPCWGVSTGEFAGVSTVDPTTVTDDHWVRVEPPRAPAQKTFGKWLVFKQFEELDETWHMIRKAVESGELDSTGAKCSTAKPDPLSHPRDSSEGVIRVYTSEEMMDEVGFKLVHMVKQDIRYKTDEATLQGRYNATGYTTVSLQVIYWNDGDPYLKRYGEAKDDWSGNSKANERPRLQLLPRTKPLEDTLGGKERGEEGRVSSSIYGQAKPVDTATKDKKIEERLLRERAEMEGRGDRSLTYEGRMRGERRNESSQRERGDERGRYKSSGWGERGGRGDRREKGDIDREERGERYDRTDQRERGGKYDWSERGERYNRSDQRERGEKDMTEMTKQKGKGEMTAVVKERGERSESSGRGERGDENCPPHDGCQDTTEATCWRGRRRESHEGEERAGEEEGGNRHSSSPTVK